MTTIGFLHTADVHVDTFRALVRELAPDHRDVHVVDARLLADARDGVDEALLARLTERLRELAGLGPDVIVCTCSTLSGCAEQISVGVPVLRVDRPMAEAAVTLGGRIAVVAAVASTLAPTCDLLRESAAGAEIELVEAPCPAAWALFEAGDVQGYLRRVADHVRTLDADVVVLAQASMAPAADLLTDLPIPVLSSPRAAVLRATTDSNRSGQVHTALDRLTSTEES